MHDLRLDAATALDTLRGYDLVIDGTDNFATRYLVNDACVLLGLPLVWGSIFRFDGQTTLFWANPPAGHGYTGVHYRDVFPDPRRAPIGPLADIAVSCAVPPPTPVAAAHLISAERLAERLADRARGTDDFDLVDVREQHEHDEVAIPGARLVPRGHFLDGGILAWVTAFGPPDPHG